MSCLQDTTPLTRTRRCFYCRLSPIMLDHTAFHLSTPLTSAWQAATKGKTVFLSTVVLESEQNTSILHNTGGMSYRRFSGRVLNKDVRLFSETV